jgi:hypothetical protein
MAIFDWSLVVASIGLVVATLVLAWFTRSLYRVTKRLAETEDKRDREESRLRRRDRLGRKLEVVEQVIHMSSEGVLKPLIEGGISQGVVATFRKMHQVVDFGSDQVMEKDVKRLLLAFDNGNRGTKYPDAIVDLEPVLKRVQERLSWDLFKWREELVELTPGVVFSENEL